jgi:hypothetical protein
LQQLDSHLPKQLTALAGREGDIGTAFHLLRWKDIHRPSNLAPLDE